MDYKVVDFGMLKLDVEDDDMNLICLRGHVAGFASAQELILAFLKATFSGVERHLRRLQKIKQL